MRMFLYGYDNRPVQRQVEHYNIIRAETTAFADDGQQFRVILLDAEDSFDVVIEYPNDVRECVWSLAKDRLGFNATDASDPSQPQ